MASGLEENGSTRKSSYLTPIVAVRDFFESLTSLKSLSRSKEQDVPLAEDSEK